MHLSPLREAKLRHMFSVYDHDGNGLVERADYDATIANFASARQLTPGSMEYRRLEEAYLSVWHGLVREADADGDQGISFEEMLHYNERIIHDPQLFDEHVVALGDLLFELLDANGDGHVIEDEYVEFLRCLGVDGDQGAFTRLDLSGAGKLSKRDVRQRIQEFYFSDREDAPGNWLFGPLPQDGGGQ